MRTIEIRDESHWHELRAKNIGSSESAALFDQSPYVTRFTLWMSKAGRAELPPHENDRIEAGKCLEAGIAEMVAREMRWNLESRPVYCMHDTVEGMGCTIDRWVVDNERGPGIVEIKNVDWLVWKKDWTETKAPFHIEMQLQHQLAVAGAGFKWGAIVPLVGGNDLKIYERLPDVDAIVEIESAVTAFWASVAAGAAPNAAGDVDEMPILAQLFPAIVANKRVDSDSVDLGELAQQYAWAQEQETMHKKIKEQAKVRLLEFMGDAAVGYVPGHRIELAKPQIAARTQHVKAHVQQRLTVKPLATTGARPPGAPVEEPNPFL